MTDSTHVLMNSGDFTFVQDWAACAARTCDVTLLSTDASGPAVAGIAHARFKGAALRPSRLLRPLSARADQSQIERLARTSAASVLHTHFYSTAEAAARASRRMGIPLIHTEHSSNVLTGQLSRAGFKVLSYVVGQASTTIAVSDPLRDAMHLCGLAAAIEVVPNPLSDYWFDGEIPERRSGEPRRLISVGWLEPWKDHRLLVEAFAATRPSLTGATLTIVGEGPERSALEQLIRERNLSSSIVLTGRLPREDVRTRMLEADLYVHTSQYETFGVSMVEAWACGLPVVSLPCGGVASMAEQIGGLCLRDRDVQNLADAMQMLPSPESRVAIRANCRRSFSLEAVGTHLAEIYGNLN